MRNTRQKSIILDYLKKNQESHITVDELYEQLKNNNTLVPKPTIYRNLAMLEKNNYIKKYFITDRAPACYQIVQQACIQNNHYHFVCNACGNVIHFNNYILTKALDSMETENGFKVDNNKTVFYGICNDCN